MRLAHLRSVSGVVRLQTGAVGCPQVRPTAFLEDLTERKLLESSASSVSGVVRLLPEAAGCPLVRPTALLEGLK